MRRLSVGLGLLPSVDQNGKAAAPAPRCVFPVAHTQPQINGFGPPPHAAPSPCSRARKSFGTELSSNASAAAPSVNGVALSQMYQTVLKMSSENVRPGAPFFAGRGPSLFYVARPRPPTPRAENHREEQLAATAH